MKMRMIFNIEFPVIHLTSNFSIFYDRETGKALEPLQIQIGKLQHSVKGLNDQIREKKAVILQNEGLIEKLVLNMVTSNASNNKPAAAQRF